MELSVDHQLSHVENNCLGPSFETPSNVVLLFQDIFFNFAAVSTSNTMTTEPRTNGGIGKFASIGKKYTFLTNT